MEFNHLSFYVDEVAPWRDWFVHAWGGVWVGPELSPSPGQPAQDKALVYVGQVPLLIVAVPSTVTQYLQHHPPGIGDIALRVADLEQTLRRVAAAGGKVIQPIQTDAWGRGCWGQIQGWGSLSHTLVETWQGEVWVPGIAPSDRQQAACSSSLVTAIDHAVVNVPTGELTQAVAWYTSQLGFQPRQRFAIDTSRSGLRSQVLAHPEGSAQLPINEPTTANSQVQEFLDYNRGGGIQHVALHTEDIVHTVEQLRSGGVSFLPVPQNYYEALEQRPGYQTQGDMPSEWLSQRKAAIARLQILVDWDPHLPQARLLQTFTQPFLSIPTVFFELIQRQVVRVNGDLAKAQGFGERNFQALFEAIEREQMKRGSLA
ncbi:4-hydroxyphenylpyruvate dioxygenase [Nodosilinea sp. FACHB-13]|uniref:4-hydroxyphenylpyruvate dioxygenase n=1 Tax=Cyanophyceae TaxID=3028117 RepID=UPI001689EBBE|nr:4-hydroxyphenylpyruvate dioxygenase [Nodosilinea sp. FACHB-13]MBD2105885.1 4-hydroxyphenylpyruvate dioxygenase [Nodosilinea sp. FACHB-13]